MLTTRVIPVIFLMDGRIVRSERCSEFKVLGNPFDELARYDEWQADEVCYVNISRSGWKPDTSLMRAIADRAFMPFTYGGNLKTLDDVSWAIANGADKVLIGRAASPEFISQIANKFGSQACVVSIDDGSTERAAQAERAGAGEIFLHAVELDGIGTGYDLGGISCVSRSVGIPVVAAGGCGQPSHCVDALKAGADAVAIGNWLHFVEGSYNRAKRYLRKQGFNVRLDLVAA